jgi:cobalt-zinc-cadmium efflux system protein
MRMRGSANFKLLFLISFLLFLLEALAGYLSHSLSLLSDSLHLLSDNLSLLLSFFALKFVKRPPSLKATFGYQKLGLLFTLFNGLFLVLSSLYILYEAVERLKSPNPINLKIMLPVAIVGLLGNVLMLFILHKASRRHPLEKRLASYPGGHPFFGVCNPIRSSYLFIRI